MAYNSDTDRSNTRIVLMRKLGILVIALAIVVAINLIALYALFIANAQLEHSLHNQRVGQARQLAMLRQLDRIENEFRNVTMHVEVHSN